MWSWPVPNHVPWEIPLPPHDGAFGTRRKHDNHTGIDLYCPTGTPVHAVEDGVVARVEAFTGAAVGSPWWNDTNIVLVKGPSGVVGYGEVKEDPDIKPGVPVKRGQRLGVTLQVMTHQKHGRPMTMLHIELYKDEGFFTDAASTTEWWYHDQPQPSRLLDPTKKLRQAWIQVTDRFHRDSADIPHTAEGRRALINWVLDHPLWTYPIPSRTHLPGERWMTKLENGNYQMTDPTGPEEDVMMGSLFECADLSVVYVDPTDERISDDPARNTDFRIWLETGGWMDQSLDEPSYEPDGGWTKYNKWAKCHDYRLDCGARTMEDLLVQLALRVGFYYGELRDAPEVMKPCECTWLETVLGTDRPVSTCVDAGDGFCQTCGYLMDRLCKHPRSPTGTCVDCDQERLPPEDQRTLELFIKGCDGLYRKLRDLDDCLPIEDEELREVVGVLLRKQKELEDVVRAGVKVDIIYYLEHAEPPIIAAQEYLQKHPSAVA